MRVNISFHLSIASGVLIHVIGARWRQIRYIMVRHDLPAFIPQVTAFLRYCSCEI